MKRVLSGREEILRVERRFYTDTMSSVNATLSALEQKFDEMHSREIIGEHRILQYRFDILRIRTMLYHSSMQRQKAADTLLQMREIVNLSNDQIQYAHLVKEEYRFRSDIEINNDDERILRESLDTFIKCGELQHAFRCALTLVQHTQKADKYDRCLQYLQKALDIKKGLPGVAFLEAQYQLASGNYHISIQDFDQAEICLNKAIEYSINEHNWRTALVAWSNIASIYLMRTDKKPAEALAILEDCLEMATRKKAYHDVSRILVMCGSAHTTLENHKEALAYFTKAEILYRKYPFPLHEATLHYKLARLFMNMQGSGSRNAKIESHFHRAHSITNEHGFLQLRIWVLRHWGLWLKTRKKWDRAFSLLQESYETQQLVIGKDAQKNIKLLEVEYAANTHLQENESLKQQNKVLGQEATMLRHQLLERTSSIMKEMNRYGEMKTTIMSILEQQEVKPHVLKLVSSSLLPLSISEFDKEVFYSEFNQTYPGFQDRLEALIPDITVKEKQICSLIKCGFNTYHIATFLEISTRTVETHRLSIRKKAGLSSKDTIDRYLQSIDA